MIREDEEYTMEGGKLGRKMTVKRRKSLPMVGKIQEGEEGGLPEPPTNVRRRSTIVEIRCRVKLD